MKSKILRFVIGFCFLPAMLGVCTLIGMLPPPVILALFIGTICVVVGAAAVDLFGP